MKKQKAMSVIEAGRLGGKRGGLAKSERKRLACLTSLAKAREEKRRKYNERKELEQSQNNG